MHPGGELTAKLYGLYMKEHAEAFFRNNSAYAGQWDDLPQSLRDALLVTYTNLGEEKMQQLIKSPYEPQPALTSGGGMNHLRNAQAIGRAIGLEGYGQDAEAVVNAEDLANLAKRDDATGLAARYALARLRHVVVETGVDIVRHNQNGELDLYDANTAPNGMSEQYLTDRASFLWRLFRQGLRMPPSRLTKFITWMQPQVLSFNPLSWCKSMTTPGFPIGRSCQLPALPATFSARTMGIHTTAASTMWYSMCMAALVTTVSRQAEGLIILIPALVETSSRGAGVLTPMFCRMTERRISSGMRTARE